MSSLQEKKALALIAVAHGAALSIGKNYSLGPEFAGKISNLADLLKTAGRQWPVSGSDADVPAWVAMAS